MDFLDLARERYSLRDFDSRQVEQAVLEKVLEAGRLAPTAVNRQPQRILVLRRNDDLEKVKQCTKYHFNAPTILAICYNRSESWKNKWSNQDYGIVDATIVITQMMLEATELGLGTTFVGAFDTAMFRELFKLPAYFIPVALLPIGYPAANAQPSALHSRRKPLSDTVFYENFDKIIGNN